MKKRFLVILLLTGFLFPKFVLAVEWHPTNQATLAWEAVIIDQGMVEYELFLIDASDETVKNAPAVEGRTDLLEYTFTIADQGKWLCGVRAVKIVDGADVAKSEIAWSDIADYCKDGNTFGIIYYIIGTTKGLFIK